MKHPAQEADRVPGRRIAGIIAATVVATVAGVLVAVWIGSCRAHDLGGGLTGLGEDTPPADVNALETRPFRVEAQGLAEHRAAAAWLGRYGWVDRAHGLVHVPIDVAIDLYLERRRRPR